MKTLEKLKNGRALAVVGLGYVGLPLALAFAKKVRTIGFDINKEKLATYQRGIDPTKETGDEAVKETTLHFTADPEELSDAAFIIVAVPTPVTDDDVPDLAAVKSASRIVGEHLRPGTIVCYESTVYPGVTRRICAPILEEASGLVCGQDFKVAYSPERINPGDKVHRLQNICKIVSATDETALEDVAQVYGMVIEAENICLGLLILGLIYFLALSDIFHPKQVASYENFTEISEEYDATAEINEATEIYAKSADMARIVKGTPGTDKKVVYLTFNGMESRGNMEGIVKAMLQHGFHGTFFVEGANAAHEEKVTQKLVDEDQLIGNYGFVGITKAERLDKDRLIEQFCKTQKVLSLVAGHPATYFALPETRYLPALLRAAKACGLDYAVASDIVIKESDFTRPNGVEKLLQQIQPGMVVSIRLDHPVPIIFYEKKEADIPAIDKKPTIKDDVAADGQSVPIVEAVQSLCNALADQGYAVEPVSALVPFSENIREGGSSNGS